MSTSANKAAHSEDATHLLFFFFFCTQSFFFLSSHFPPRSFSWPLHPQSTHAPSCRLSKCHLAYKCDELLAALSYLSVLNRAVFNPTTGPNGSRRCRRRPLPPSRSPSISSRVFFPPLIDYLSISKCLFSFKRLSAPATSFHSSPPSNRFCSPVVLFLSPRRLPLFIIFVVRALSPVCLR